MFSHFFYKENEPTNNNSQIDLEIMILRNEEGKFYHQESVYRVFMSA